MGFINFLLRKHRLILIIHFMITGAMLPGLLRLRSDNSVQVYFPGHSSEIKRYTQFKQDFSKGQILRISVRGEGLWTDNGLDWMTRLEDKIAMLPGVVAAAGITSRHRWLSLEWPPSRPLEFRKQVLADGFDRNAGWVSENGSTATMSVILDSLEPDEIRAVMNQLERMISEHPEHIRCGFSGIPAIQNEMDSTLTEVISFFLPLLFVLAGAFLFFIFRRVGLVVVPLLYVSVSMVILFGAMGYFGVKINLVNSILALLLCVIGLATAVHLQVRYVELFQNHGRRDTILETFRSKAKPVVWTGLTTLIAFGSMMTGNIASIRVLGIWACVGMTLLTVLAFTMIPPLWALAGSPASPKNRKTELRMREIGGAWAGWGIKQRRFVLIGLIIIAGLAAPGIAHLDISDNIIEYFPKENPIRAEMEKLDSEHLGSTSVEMIIARNTNSLKDIMEGDTMRQPVILKNLIQLGRRLRRHPQIHGTASAGDLVEAAARTILVEGEMTDNIRWLALGMMQSAEEGRRALNTMLAPDGQSARLTLLVPMMSGHRMRPLMEEWSREAKAFFPDCEIWISGEYPLILEAQRSLLRGLILSLTVTLLCITVLFLIFIKRARWAFLALVPNLFPLLCVFGAMGWLHIRIDSVSVMTASLVLGLAVDDTLHSMGFFLHMNPRSDPAEAIRRTLRTTAPAQILTTIILASGFGVCAFIPFLPFSRMGALSTAAILIALAGDLFLIPALLSGNWNRTVQGRETIRHNPE